MKIRIVTALLTAIAVSLPVSVWGQIRVRSFDSYIQNLTKGLCSPPPLLDLVEVIDMYYHVADGAITADSQGWRFGTRNGVCFRNDIYNYESWPALGVNGILIWEEYDQQGNLVDYWEAEQQPFDTWYFLPWRRWNRTVYATNTWNNISYIEEFHTNDIVTIDLVTDGTPGVNGQRLWRLEAAANDSTTGQPIPPNQITLLGKTALATNWYGDWYPYTNIGVVYKVFSDNSVADATPTIPRESITYDVKAFPARLLIKWDNTDVTDKTNVVWVGEKIHLACSLSSQIAIITNFQWTVPGKRIANWDVAADDRYARTPLTGTNGPTVQFHWVLDQTGTLDVVCKVQVEGETLTAKTTYEIRRPTASWNLYPQDVVQVTTNCQPASPAVAGYYHLTTGKGFVGTNVGMYYVGYMDDLKGYPSNVNYTVSFVQLVSTTLRANMQTTNAQSWIANLKAGLDTEYPYAEWTRGQPIFTVDTPKSPLHDTETYYWRTDGFASYLMWKSERRAGSIPVPLRVAHWDWYGATQKMDRNNPPTWRLNGWTNQRAAAGVDTAVHPKWEFIVNAEAVAENKIFNNFTYATP